MRRKKQISERKNEQGLVITLVAVFMLFVVGAMAALSIDVVTLYTARSEAQLAADSAALAGARVLANSGMTSASDATLGTNAAPIAIAVATQVAASNQVGGRNLIPGASTCISTGQEICVTINTAATTPAFVGNPQVLVQVQRTDLPTFFARIWGSATITVKASATAEAYNPSPSSPGAPVTPPLPVAPLCVKPWLLPNMDPTMAVNNPANHIFDPVAGTISDYSLLGWTAAPPTTTIRLRTACTTCSATSAPSAPTSPWRYYPGTTDPGASFPAPSASSCTGCAGFSNYQLSIAGCVQTPISCNQTVNIDQTPDGNRNIHTREAVDTLTHATGNGGDSVDTAVSTPPLGSAPFEFLAGSQNPVVLSGALAAEADIMVSDSLVTVPVINVDNVNWPAATSFPGFPSVQIIGFVQLFLSPTGAQVPFNGQIHTQVINLVGCGTGATGTPILGNGASPVAVRLISQ